MKKIIKSQSDKRQYRYGQLKNKLQYIIIQDTQAQKSAASVDVRAGSLEDPPTRPGLAHFCEHMLFLGNQKYPQQSQFFDNLKKTGGRNNAYTDLNNTNYFFDSSNEGFLPNLDRFSNFFKTPLFTESCTEREMKAVDSENKKNLQSDIWRQMQLWRSQANPGSPLCRFATGNLETLNHPNAREDLLNYYNNNYSANRLKLVVYSQKSLDQVEQKIQEMFVDVPNRDLAPNDYSKKLASYDQKNLGRLYKIVPVTNKDSISFSWVINQSFQKHIDSKPGHYISHLIGHEGPNSLLSLLKSQNLAMELFSSSGNYLDAFSTVKCKISLTKKGLEQWQRVVSIVYQYIENIRAKGLQKWLFQEMKTVEQTNFKFKNKQNFINYVSSLSSYMQILEPEQMDRILVSRSVTSEYDADAIGKILNSMTPQNSNIYLVSKQFQDSCNSQDMMVQKWYQTKFWKQQFSEQLKERMNKPNLQKELSQKLDYPPKNILVSDKFDLIQNPQNKPYPELVSVKNGSQLWFLQDHQFKAPKASIGVKIYTNDNNINTQISGRLFLSFFIRMLNENMNQFNYMADMANLSFEFNPKSNNFDLTFHGFNQSLKTYVIEVMKKIVAYKPEASDQKEKQTFARVRQQMIRQYKDQSLREGYQQVIKKLDVVLNKSSFDTQDKAKIINDQKIINFEWFANLRKKFLKKAHLVWFVAGNYSKEQGKWIQEECSKILGFAPNNQGEQAKQQNQYLKRQDVSQVLHVKIPDNDYLIYQKQHGNKENVNSCIASYFQRRPKSHNFNDQQIGKILFEIMQQPFFSQLRTQQQLGYIVFSGFYLLRNVPAARFIVQSSVGSPEFLASRIDQFLKNFRKEKLQSLTQEDIDKFKNAAISQASQKDLSIRREFTRQFQEIKNHDYIMDKKEKIIEIMKRNDVVTKQSLIQYFDDLFLESKGVRRLDIQIVSSNHLDNQKDWKEKRMDGKLNRKYIRGDNGEGLQDFKKNSAMFPDLIKANWMDYFKSSKL